MELLQSNANFEVAKLLNKHGLDLAQVYRVIDPDEMEKELFE